MASIPKQYLRDTIVLYHRGCNDGIASAWAAYGHLGEDADYMPWQYGDPLPDLKGKKVFLVDLSFTKEQIDAVVDDVQFIVIIDHHKSAIENLEYQYPQCKGISELPVMVMKAEGRPVFLCTDITRSGAVLTWRFFNDIGTLYFTGDPTIEVPEVLLWIEDYDLWKHHIPEGKALNAWLINGPLTIERFNEVATAKGDARMHIVNQGNMLMAYDNKIINSLIREYIQLVEVGGNKIPFINAPHHLRNEIGDRLSKKYPYVVLYTERDGKTIYSLRSSNVPVDGFAKYNGGGGHAFAAAFRMDHTWIEVYKHSLIYGNPTWRTKLKVIWRILRGK
jgi:hypothetical protein